MNKKEKDKQKEIEKWNEILKKEGLEELKDTYTSDKDFWKLDISRRKKYSN
jgi:hypothetical protein